MKILLDKKIIIIIFFIIFCLIKINGTSIIFTCDEQKLYFRAFGADCLKWYLDPFHLHVQMNDDEKTDLLNEHELGKIFPGYNAYTRPYGGLGEKPPDPECKVKIIGRKSMGRSLKCLICWNKQIERE